MKALLILIALVLCDNRVLGQCGSFSLASYYSDHMVLQRAPSNAQLWGYADTEGQTITVEFGEFNADVNAFMDTEEGRVIWKAQLPATAGGGPHSISVTSDGCTLSINDVLFGDVYICVGQTNMDFALIDTIDGEAEVADAVNYPQIRTIHTDNRVHSHEPLYDVESYVRNWEITTQENIANFSGVCWMYAREIFRAWGQPIGLIHSSHPGTIIETWSSPDTIESCEIEQDPEEVEPNLNSMLYHSIIHPYLRMSIFSAIYYQGESNFFNQDEFVCMMTSLVADWRLKWHQSTEMSTDAEFPFGVVQISPWKVSEPVNWDFGYPDTRWAQTAYHGYLPNVDMPRTYMATAVDLPDADSPLGAAHPRYKRQISERLSLSGRTVAYGEEVGFYNGPFPVSVDFQGSHIHIEFDQDGLEFRDSQEVTAYEICCRVSETDTCDDVEDWTPAPMFGEGNDQVNLQVNCDSGQFVVAVRYMWRESPCLLELCPIYQTNSLFDLPAPPYRHDGVIGVVP